jgi:hypothetical protein
MNDMNDINTVNETRQTIMVHYKNWKGTIRTREIRPVRVEWGASEWHPEQQWLLIAVDMEDGKQKMFALKDCDFRHSDI